MDSRYVYSRLSTNIQIIKILDESKSIYVNLWFHLDYQKKSKMTHRTRLTFTYVFITRTKRMTHCIILNYYCSHPNKDSMHMYDNIKERSSRRLFCFVGNQTYNETRDRVRLEPDTEYNVPNAVLIVEDAVLSDRLQYTCVATSIFTNLSRESTTQVRVKGTMTFYTLCSSLVAPLIPSNL